MLKASDLHVAYGSIRAVQGLSIEVGPKECVAIVGGNGAGKTTVLKTISGLQPLVNGRLTFEGSSLTGKRVYEIAEMGIAHVPEGRRVFPEMTVLDNLIMGSFARRAKPYRLESLEYIFSLFPRLAERQKQLAGTLSGGEQQMLAVARGLMLRPKLLMLDEPSSGLAPIVVEQMYEKLGEIRKQNDMAMLLVEQNVPIALSIADRGYVLENGKVALEGTSQELLGNPEVREAYLGFH